MPHGIRSKYSASRSFVGLNGLVVRLASVLISALVATACGTSGTGAPNAARSGSAPGASADTSPGSAVVGGDSRRPSRADDRRASILAALRAGSEAAWTCFTAYEIRNASDFDSLLVDVSFVVTPEGRVGADSVAVTSQSDAEMNECIRTAIAGWRFPGATGVADTRIQHRLRFTTKLPDGTRSLHPRVAQRIILEGAPALQKCYQEALRRDARLQHGPLEITLTIKVNPDGLVGGAEFNSSPNSEMILCFESEAAKWVFPPFGGPTVTIQQAIRLKPVP